VSVFFLELFRGFALAGFTLGLALPGLAPFACML
jgi:hypothetical protein